MFILNLHIVHFFCFRLRFYIFLCTRVYLLVCVTRFGPRTAKESNNILLLHLMAYFRSNISAKKYQNRLMHVVVIECNTSVVFETQCNTQAHAAKAMRSIEGLRACGALQSV